MGAHNFEPADIFNFLLCVLILIASSAEPFDSDSNNDETNETIHWRGADTTRTITKFGSILKSFLKLQGALHCV